jgi:hypothetical protein
MLAMLQKSQKSHRHVRSGEGAQTMCTHVSKCENDKIKGEKM